MLPQPSVLTVFPGDIVQFLTDRRLLSTPHKVRLNTRQRRRIEAGDRLLVLRDLREKALAMT